MAEIFERLSKVMEDVGAIRKLQKNEFDRYNFRGIDDVYNAVQPALVKHGVLIVPEVKNCSIDSYETAKGAVMQRSVLTVAYHFWAPDGSEVVTTVVGEGADRGDKAINKAHSSAYKNALFQTLCIPTEEKSDSEHDSPEAQARKTVARAEKDKPAPKPDRPDPTTPIRTSAIGERLLVAMRSRCTEVGVNPEDCSRGALHSIIDKLKIEKTAAMLTKHHQIILDHIEVWNPPGDESGDDFASSPTLGNTPKEMASLHVWIGEDVGIRDSKRAHAALHAALPVGVDSLRDLPVSKVAELKQRVRDNDGMEAT